MTLILIILLKFIYPVPVNGCPSDYVRRNINGYPTPIQKLLEVYPRPDSLFERRVENYVCEKNGDLTKDYRGATHGNR